MVNPDDEALEALEIDLEVADIGELLVAHGITPTPELVTALWKWKEARLRNGAGQVSTHRQVARQIELFLEDGDRNRLIVALAVIDGS